MGGNIAAAVADSEFTQQAIRQADLNVQISTKLNRSRLQVSKDALILPCLGRTEIDQTPSGEQKITVEDTFSMVHASQGKTKPVSNQLRSEVNIVANIGLHTLGNNPVDWQQLAHDYDHIRHLISQCVSGFESYNERLLDPGGFYLGNPAAKLNWNTNSGKAEFSNHKLPEQLFSDAVVDQIDNCKDKVFTLQSLRSHDQYNTTIYGMNDKYRGIEGERKVIFINPKDAKRLDLNEGEMVDITAIWHDNITRRVTGYKVVYFDIPRDNLAAYYPETNALVAIDSVGDQSYTPTSKSIPVILAKNQRQIISKTRPG